MNIKTFARNLMFSPYLLLRASGGISGEELPPQRLFFLESQSSGYAPFGVLKTAKVKEFNGSRFVMINIEHNFRGIPFLAIYIPYLYHNNIELVMHTSIAQTWHGRISSSNGWYSEAGLGVSRILDILRFDLTYRFKSKKSLFFTVNLATYF